MNRLILVVLTVAFSNLVHTQNTYGSYSFYVKKADSLRASGNYNVAIENYRKGFSYLDGKGYIEDRINLAECFSKIGSNDSVFYQFYRLLKVEWNDSAVLFNRFGHLKTHPKYIAIIDTIREREYQKKLEYELYDKALLTLLKKMEKEDQDIRKDKSKWGLMREIDSIHYPVLVKIFNQYGFLNYDIVGKEGSHSFWLLVQHQDLHPSFQDSVVQKMKIELEKGKASKKNYAYLVDRVYLNTGRNQIYGTQMQYNNLKKTYTPRPLEKPESVNQRRQEMGLENLEEYIKYMNDRH